MSQFLAEYRMPLPDTNGGFVSTFIAFEADTIQLAQREVERVISTSGMNEAVLFQAVKQTKASRVVASSDMSSGPKVVIGSGLDVTTSVGEKAV
jgi:hypothetical protein